MTKIFVFTCLNREQDKVVDRPGSDIMADVGKRLAWRWEGGESGRWSWTDGCPVAGHIRGAGGQADSNRCSPPSNLCLGNQKHMALHNGSSVVL